MLLFQIAYYSFVAFLIRIAKLANTNLKFMYFQPEK